jgi:hypothetical protein
MAVSSTHTLNNRRPTASRIATVTPIHTPAINVRLHNLRQACPKAPSSILIYALKRRPIKNNKVATQAGPQLAHPLI